MMNFKSNKAFTIIELVVVMAIIVVLYGIITFSAGLYINKGKDSSIQGNLATLIPAGEVYYNYSGDSSYTGFCDPAQNSVLKNSIEQMPKRTSGNCFGDPLTPTTNPAAVCCLAVAQAWAACAKEFVTSTKYYCVDSRGVKKEITGTCNLTTLNLAQCPEN